VEVKVYKVFFVHCRLMNKEMLAQRGDCLSRCLSCLLSLFEDFRFACCQLTKRLRVGSVAQGEPMCIPQIVGKLFYCPIYW
jgi:hypothetical protein